MTELAVAATLEARATALEEDAASSPWTGAADDTARALVRQEIAAELRAIAAALRGTP